MGFVIGPKRFTCGFDLGIAACQCDQSWMHHLGKFCQDLGCISLRIDGDKNGRYVLSGRFQQIHGFNIAHRIHWADIGAERISKIKQSRSFVDIVLRHALPVLVY